MRVLLILLFLFSSSAIGNECGWFLDNFTSPLCTDAKYIFWTGAVATVGLRFIKKDYAKEVQDQTVHKNHLRNWGGVGGDIGEGYLNGAYFLGQLIWGGRAGNARAEHMLEASFYSFGVTQALKRSIHETRPGFQDLHDSFPSGHASFAFAFASVVTAQHGWPWGIPAHLLASYIAFSRMNDNWHYLHDVVAGMTIGLSYGWGTYFNHKYYRKPYWLAVIPGMDLRSGMISFAYRY